MFSTIYKWFVKHSSTAQLSLSCTTVARWVLQLQSSNYSKWAVHGAERFIVNPTITKLTTEMDTQQNEQFTIHINLRVFFLKSKIFSFWRKTEHISHALSLALSYEKVILRLSQINSPHNCGIPSSCCSFQGFRQDLYIPVLFWKTTTTTTTHAILWF